MKREERREKREERREKRERRGRAEFLGAHRPDLGM